jgi:50S ribosomal protein L16 3-hydroxylase
LEERGEFIERLRNSNSILRDTTCRMAYIDTSDTQQLFINGCQWNIEGVSFDLIKPIANARTILISELLPFLAKETDQQFLHDMWKLQWISIL